MTERTKEKSPGALGGRRSLTVGAVTGGIIGAALGCAYGIIPDIPKLDVGAIPGWAVGLFFGAAFGSVLGSLSAAAGRTLLTGRAALGYLIAVAIIIIGRLSDDTGGTKDKIMDMIVGGIGWGVFGALIGASLGGDESESTENQDSNKSTRHERQA